MGDFGDQGTTPGHSHGTYSATGEVSAPILQIAKTRGAEQTAAANYDNAQAKLSDQIQLVNAGRPRQHPRRPGSSPSSSKPLSRTSRSPKKPSVKLSSASPPCVADDLPVSQAQSQTEQANDQFISALYQHNVAKLSLARAIGVAQTSYKTYLGGK